MRLELKHRADGTLGVHVTLSRRNLLTLLQKLSLPWSACRIETTFDVPEGMTLSVTSESDTEHYAERVPPGPTHQLTEQFLRAHVGCYTGDSPDLRGAADGPGADGRKHAASDAGQAPAGPPAEGHP